MKIQSAVDAINQRTMRSAVLEYSAIVGEDLNAQERAALGSVIEEISGKRILDIGIGAGRTVTALRAISADYVGVDYVQEMVDHCSSRFPGARFERVDARSMKQFHDAAFDLVCFFCNGISMVDHDGRLAILREVRRVLAPQGVFIFSTCNRNSPQYEAVFRFPEFQWARNPVKLMVRSARFLAQSIYRVVNRLRYRTHEVRIADYAIINDVCHHYRTMLYFTTAEDQIRQLRSVGFDCEIKIYDLSGELVVGQTRDGTVTFVVKA